MNVWQTLLISLATIVIVVCLVNARRIYNLRNIPDKKNLEEQIDQLGTDFLRGNEHANIVIGIIKHGQKYVKGFGNESGLPSPDQSTLFEVPELAKLFTTTCLISLANQNGVSLDDNIRDYLPAGKKLAEHVSDTTLMHLATHTSGFPFMPEEVKRKIRDPIQPYRDIRKSDVWEYLLLCTEKCRPGIFKKSDIGISLLAYLLEEKTGLTFSELVQREICAPLKMKNTTAQISDNLKKQLVQGYGPTGNKEDFWHSGAFYGAGAIYTNMEDILLFLDAHIHSRDDLISQTLVGTHKRFSENGAVSWMTAREYEKTFGLKDILWIGGRTAGFSSYLAIDIKEKNAAAIIASAGIPTDKFGAYLMHILRRTSFAEVTPGILPANNKNR